MRSVIACKNCKYYDDIEDATMPGYRECHYFFMLVNRILYVAG